MGPIIPGEEHVHLTFFMNGEVFNAHLKIIENGKTHYKNLTVMSPWQFKERIQRIAKNMLNSFQPTNPNQDVVTMTKRGQKLFQKLAFGSLTVTYKGRKGYVDFDFGVIVDEIQNFAENPTEYFTITRAYNLIGPDPLRFGFTEEGMPIFPTNNQIYSWRTTGSSERIKDVQNQDDSFSFFGETSWGRPIYDLASIIGIPQLFSEIEQRRLVEKWAKKNLLSVEKFFKK